MRAPLSGESQVHSPRVKLIAYFEMSLVYTIYVMKCDLCMTRQKAVTKFAMICCGTCAASRMVLERQYPTSEIGFFEIWDENHQMAKRVLSLLTLPYDYPERDEDIIAMGLYPQQLYSIDNTDESDEGFVE